MAEKITKGMTIAEIVGKYPETVPTFLEAGMHCIGCALAGGETLEAGALSHGIDADALTKKLNQSIKRRK
jgi:hybrid cluster-associated redox disulfide protein